MLSIQGGCFYVAHHEYIINCKRYEVGYINKNWCYCEDISEPQKINQNPSVVRYQQVCLGHPCPYCLDYVRKFCENYHYFCFSYERHVGFLLYQVDQEITNSVMYQNCNEKCYSHSSLRKIDSLE